MGRAGTKQLSVKFSKAPMVPKKDERAGSTRH